MNADQYIQHLQLQPHPEGGFYREVFRSKGMISAQCLPPPFDGNRHFCTAIYYLLQKGDYSAFHRIKSDELWHFYAGGALQLHVLDPAFGYECRFLGNAMDGGAQFQLVMPAGAWFAAEPAAGTDFTLAGCTVSPGFDFRDFEMANAGELALRYPEQEALIQRLCR